MATERRSLLMLLTLVKAAGQEGRCMSCFGKLFSNALYCVCVCDKLVFIPIDHGEIKQIV